MAATVVGAVMSLLLLAPPALANHHFASFVTSRCLTQETDYGTMMRAKVWYRIGTYADKKNNLSGIRMKARFIPTTSGTSYFRPWGEYLEKGVLDDGYNDFTFHVTTPPERADKDWNLQVKISWYRNWKRDWHYEKLFTWNESFCQSSSPFSLQRGLSLKDPAGSPMAETPAGGGA